MIDTLNLLDALIVRESFRMRLMTLIEILKYLKIKIITSVLKRNTFGSLFQILETKTEGL